MYMCIHILAQIMGVDFKTKIRHDKAANRFDALIFTIRCFPRRKYVSVATCFCRHRSSCHNSSATFQ